MPSSAVLGFQHTSLKWLSWVRLSISLQIPNHKKFCETVYILPRATIFTRLDVLCSQGESKVQINEYQLLIISSLAHMQMNNLFMNLRTVKAPPLFSFYSVVEPHLKHYILYVKNVSVMVYIILEFALAAAFFFVNFSSFTTDIQKFSLVLIYPASIWSCTFHCIYLFYFRTEI